jgi:hypothetical protein
MRSMRPEDLSFLDYMSVVMITIVTIYTIGYFLASILLTLEKRFPGTILRGLLIIIGIISLNGAWVIFEHYNG